MPTTSSALPPLLAVALILGCSDSSGPSRPPVCDGPVTVTATDAQIPRVSWAPDCRISGISVGIADPDAVPFPFWRVSSPVDSNPIEGPLDYGEAIPGTFSLGAGDLPMGDSVLFSLYASDSETPDTLYLVGEAVVHIPFLPDVHE